ncbi:MAG: triose-phosphate isomerase [Paracoccus sp. (in: a-proteobacteria)]|uniref:triose-phosphate isomerase n=1 Tax=Paracoccus sp. TaxID=267 RepID=UPI004058BA49
MAPRKLVAGNWKMNGDLAALDQVDEIAQAAQGANCDVLICPPALLVHAMKSRVGDMLLVGGQDCHAKASGAHTGDIAARQLRDVGATHVIVGHSERRADHAETSEDVAAKAAAAHEAGLTAIICLGETEDQRDAGTTLEVIARQLAASLPPGATAGNTVVAYEPVWAIGTGRVPDAAQIAEVHDKLRQGLCAQLPDGADMTLLYGGSVKASNAAEIFTVPNVDGALVGGASLVTADFVPIIRAMN